MSRLTQGFDFSFQRKDRADEFLDQNAPPDLGMKMFGLTMLMIGFLWLERGWRQGRAFVVKVRHFIARGACKGSHDSLGCVTGLLPIHRESTDVRVLASQGLSAMIVANGLARGVDPARCSVEPIVLAFRFGLRSLPRSSEYVAGCLTPRARRTLIARMS